MKPLSTLEVAKDAFEKHLIVHKNFDHYAGILSLHGFTRIATECNSPHLIEQARAHLIPYVEGKRSWTSNFPNYLCGGNATAWMLYKGHLPEAQDIVRLHADKILQEAPRNNQGILCHPQLPGENAIWIDVAFAICPFLLFAGLALDEDAYLEEAYQQCRKMVESFLSPENGLLHQCRNFRGQGHISKDHWSRGNGWGALAMAELATHLPANHRCKESISKLYADHISACAAYQDEQGLWHQEMTDHKYAYTETSGSALMLYALGLGLQAGIISDDERARLESGLTGLISYINSDLDIYHTCRGCLCPGEGTILDYRAVPAVLNDVHAFGPVILAMSQAHLIGLTSIHAHT